MLRLATVLFAALVALVTAPAAAQSFALLSMPVVYVSKPVVQQVHDGRAIAPVDAAPRRQAAVYLPAPASIVVPHAFSAPPSGLPRWRPEAGVPQVRARPSGVLRYGPFRVVDGRRVALVGETDSDSPRWFAALLRDHPGLSRLEMVECPGTLDDRANMRLGRMIRAAGLATHVPAHGSVRSGAVELFLAGVARSIEDGAEFAVHSWRDSAGREASDFAADAPENRAYLDYYRDMGMSAGQARAFYDFTNSVPHHRARWLDARDMRPWLGDRTRGRPASAAEPAPRLAYASLT